MYLLGWVFQAVTSHSLPHSAVCLVSGAALGPLLAGLISPSGWHNVFSMLMLADACALLVSRSL